MRQITIIYNENAEEYRVYMGNDKYTACNIDFLEEYFGVEEEHVIIMLLNDNGDHRFRLEVNEGFIPAGKKDGKDVYHKSEPGVYINEELVTNDEDVLKWFSDRFNLNNDTFDFTFDFYTV